MATTKPSLGDRYADWAVVIVTVLALLLGGLFMDSVQSRTLPFEAGGIQADIPAGWMQSEPQGDVLVQARQRTSDGYQTTYIISKQLLHTDGGENEAVSLLTLKNGQELTAYRVLDQRLVTLDGREAYEVSYAFVEANPNITHADLPVVVRGVDYIFFTGEGALIVTYRASESEYEGGLAGFHRFLGSIRY